MNRWRRRNTGLHRTPAVRRLARELRLDVFAVQGRIDALADYWTDHADQATGVLVADLTDLDDEAGHDGFAEALVAAGIIIVADGGLTWWDWDETTGRQARERLAERAKKARQRSTGSPGDSGGKSQRQAGEVPPLRHDTTRHENEDDAPTRSPSPVRNSSALTDERGAKKRAKTDGERMSAEDQQAAAKWRERLAQVDLSDSSARKAAEVLGVTPTSIDGLIGEYGQDRVKRVCVWVRDCCIDPEHPPVPNPGGLVMSTLAKASRPSEITPAGQFKRLVKGRAADNANARAVDGAIRPSRRRLDESDSDAPHQCGAIVHRNGQARPP